MDFRKRKTFLLAGLFLLVIIAAFATVPVTAQQAAPAPAAEAKTSSLYAGEVTPMSPAECGRCHSSVYNLIKNDGGKHQIECVKCHTKYHAYSPVKQNWDQIMPKCQECHGLFHGQKFPVCAQCHAEPHAPKKQITASAELAKACGDCHDKVGAELQQNPSKHTLVACGMCHHDKHGYIPSCMECHKPHTSDQTVKDCLACHPVHKPLVISYGETVKNELCGACHSPVLQKIRSTVSKHGQVACVKCHHSKHKYVPQCQECHGQPHGEVVLKKFPNCLQCHIDVHDLPAKSGK
jgi:hypothetical protein